MSDTHRRDDLGSGSGESRQQNFDEDLEECQTLQIIVNRGFPVDAMHTRKVAFFIKFSTGKNLLSQIIGDCGYFEYEEHWDTNDPVDSPHFERLITVATIETSSANAMTFRNALYNTPINNTDRSWNCQSWVGDALKILQEAELIHSNTAENAVDQMVNVVMEAPDDD